MFDENFSFLTSNTGVAPIQTSECSSAEISPFTSRCPSPRISDSHLTTPHRNISRYSPSEFYSQLRHPSVNALTAQLQSHGIYDRIEAESTDGIIESSAEIDEGIYDSPETPATSVSDLSSDLDRTAWDYDLPELTSTSSLRPSLSLEAQAFSSYSQRRRQRQALVRLQCLAQCTPDLAMLIEECHPSSLPIPTEAIWASKARSNSTSSLTGYTSCRVDKDRNTSCLTRKAPKMRKRMTR